MRPFRTGQALLPAAFWALFALMIVLFDENPGWVDSTRAYLGAILPLLGGILGAYAVLDDPALEILFSTPVPAWRLLAGRLIPPLAVLAAAAVSFQLFLAALGFDLDILGGVYSLQWTWLVPTLALTGWGAAIALAARHCAGGAMAVGAVWLIQLIARGWFLSQKNGGVFLLFLGIFNPEDARLTANRVFLSVSAVLLLTAAVALFKRQERFL
ncbi:MAG: hypothetical protein JW843_12890 [Candidatus Aminicenantes bacterium]|nr:hypothetical protein [Candidatus Aminicenantes bacterium]